MEIPHAHAKTLIDALLEPLLSALTEPDADADEDDESAWVE